MPESKPSSCGDIAPESKPSSSLLTCGDIAAQLGRDHTTVWRAIDRLRIEPQQVTRGGFRFYDPSVVEKVRAKLRPIRS